MSTIESPSMRPTTTSRAASQRGLETHETVECIAVGQARPRERVLRQRGALPPQDRDAAGPPRTLCHPQCTVRGPLGSGATSKTLAVELPRPTVRNRRGATATIGDDAMSRNNRHDECRPRSFPATPARHRDRLSECRGAIRSDQRHYRQDQSTERSDRHGSPSGELHQRTLLAVCAEGLS